MGIKESIANLRKALRTTQTNAPAVIDTLIRGLDGVETAAEEENTYSTDERIVGTWLDGSEIYEKTINTGALPVNTIKSVPHGITNIGQIIEVKGIAIGTNLAASLPITNPSGEGILVYYAYADNTNIVIRTNYTYSVYNDSYITIRYTKASATRTPENETKKIEDDKCDEATNER